MINPNNVLCVVESLVKEIQEVYLTNADAMWFGLVETSMSILKFSKLSGSKDTIYLESVSNLVNIALHGVVHHADHLPVHAGAPAHFACRLKAHAVHNQQVCQFSGGYIDVVSHYTELGKGGSSIDFCMSQPSIPSGLRAQSDQQIINDRVAIGAVDNNVVKVQIAGVAMSPGVFTINTRNALVWAKSYNYITWLIWTNAAFDSMLGILYGVSRLLGIAESDQCRPCPVEFSSILRCVCGDVTYTIDQTHCLDLESSGALWCTGMLKMINSEGNVVYIQTPFSLDGLATDLHNAGQLYIECIAVKSENSCRLQRATVFLPKFASYFAVHKVSPLAVLARCRENYNGKTWDEGLFGLYDPVLQESITQKQRHTKKRDLERIRALVDVYLQTTLASYTAVCRPAL